MFWANVNSKANDMSAQKSDVSERKAVHRLRFLGRRVTADGIGCGGCWKGVEEDGCSGIDRVVVRRLFGGYSDRG